MISITTHSLIAGCMAILYYATRALSKHMHYKREKRARGCGDIKAYRHYDPLFGLDFAYSLSKAFREHRWLAWQKEVHATQKAKTFKANFLGSRMVYSSESDNMKAMSTSHWKDFGIEPLRRANGVIDPIGGPGVSTSDGDLWQFSRDLIKPYFTRSGYSNLGRLEAHVDKLLDLVPRDGSSFDLQPLLQRWFLDTSSEFLFGETLDSLTYPERVKPSAAMVEMMRGLRVRLLLGKFLFLHRDSKWLEAVGVIRDFIDGNIDRTLAELRDCKALGQELSKRTDLLWDMARQHQDKELLRGQIIAVFVPSNDTTSILISNVFYALARNPRVWTKLQEEISALGATPLDFELLRSLKYTNWVLNETHRLYPNGIQMVRMALKDTTLPVGGGPDEREPIFIPKGTIVSCNRYLMHRDPDIWGPDAEDFVPERWEEARPMWKFVPFGGGPRICPAHVLVATEAAYVVVRFLQRFKRIESRDLEPYTPVMRIGPSNMHGVKISLMKN